MTTNDILYIEPFYGGSHQQLVDVLQRELGGVVTSLPATKWHWRMRVSALHFALNIPKDHNFKTLFASSVLNLCELVSLRPDLASLHKVLYFHENQLIYPVRKQQERDFQYGYNQILSCMVADLILFNSQFNMESFLNNLSSFLKLMPDYRPRNLSELIRPKCQVVYFPLEFSFHPQLHKNDKGANENKDDQEFDAVKTDGSLDHHCLTKHSPLHIVWPHRWEHDKGPEELCAVLQKLIQLDLDFCVSILGSHTNDIPTSFEELVPSIGPRLIHYGTPSKEQYWQILRQADVVISTAKHETFGVAMLEATYSGCYPLCPNRLVYPEIYPRECLYNTDQQLVKRLQAFCQRPSSAKQQRAALQINISQYQWTNLKPVFKQALRA